MRIVLWPCSRLGWFSLLLAVLSGSRLDAAEWRQYRGPNFDGSSLDSVRFDWTTNPPKTVWKVALQPALSSMTISGGRVFTQVRRPRAGEDREWCVALDAATGRELWAADLDLADYPDGGVGSDDGPRSTPTVDGDRVYVLTSYLKIYCLSTTTGQKLWSRDWVGEMNAPVAAWQNAASPLVLDGLVLMNCNVPGGRLTALNAMDGSIVWRAHNDAMTQATPVFARLADRDQVIFFTQSGLVSVDPKAGTQFWRYSFPFGTSTAASPVVAGDMVYCSAAYGRGAGMVRVQASGNGLSASQVWRTAGANQNHWATPIHVNGHLYGVYGQSFTSLRCIDASNGRQKWAQEGVGLGGVIKVGDKLLVSEDDGMLAIVEPDPESYREIARFRAVRGKCWNIPAVSDGRIYTRSTTEAACIDVAAAIAATPLKVEVLVRPDGSVEVQIADASGAALDPQRAGRIRIETAREVGPGTTSWSESGSQAAVSGGKLVWRDSENPGPGIRFFRAVERP